MSKYWQCIFCYNAWLENTISSTMLLPTLIFVNLQVEYHKHVVVQYTEKCNKAYSSLEDDGYIHQNLLFHIAESGT